MNIAPTPTVPDPDKPPVVPPDDPNLPDIERGPIGDPPPTIPPENAPSENPGLPPPPPRVA